MQLTVEDIEARLKGMKPAQLRAIAERVKPIVARGWLPQPGPQATAYYSEADELLYGGAAGGGKTDLLIGLATTAHKRSLLFRRQSKDLDGLWERLEQVAAPIGTTQADSNKKVMKLATGRSIEGGHLEKPGSERSWQGRPHDLIGFDEAAQLDEYKVSFVLQWLRSTEEGQRQRAVFATNPPIPEFKDGKLVDTAVGAWLERWFAPWLDEMFPNPAKDGELRWCYMRTAGDRLETVWVEGPGYYDVETGDLVEDPMPEEIDAGFLAAARSRTFIRSLLKDNVFLKDTGYAERLSGTPEPLKSMLLLGDFTVKGEDHPMQVIPTQWVLDAQARWHARNIDPATKRLRQLVLGGDVAQGGSATTVLASLCETDFFEELLTRPGRDTPNGKTVAALVLTTRRDKSLVVLDGTGGWSADAATQLTDNHEIPVEMCVASHGSTSWTANMLYKFLNVRAEMWWLFREALDPKSVYDICLPPSTRLRAQLCAPTWEPRGKTILVESKEELFKRLGSSTDEADAVIMAWFYREMAIARLARDDVGFIDRMIHGDRAVSRKGEPLDFEDPLKGW